MSATATTAAVEATTAVADFFGVGRRTSALWVSDPPRTPGPAGGGRRSAAGLEGGRGGWETGGEAEAGGGAGARRSVGAPANNSVPRWQRYCGPFVRPRSRARRLPPRTPMSLKSPPVFFPTTWWGVDQRWYGQRGRPSVFVVLKPNIQGRDFWHQVGGPWASLGKIIIYGKDLNLSPGWDWPKSDIWNFEDPVLQRK